MSERNILNHSEECLGYNIFFGSENDLVSIIKDRIESANYGSMVVDCINPHSYVVAKKNTDFHNALQCADILIPDGQGIVLASKILGRRIKKRVCGPDVFDLVNVMCNSNLRPIRYFFLGSTEFVLESIRSKLSLEFPRIEVAGVYSPSFSPGRGFSEEESDDMINAINATNCDILWIGMTAPKQEIWAQEHKHRINAKIIMPIGAAFDFYIGKIKRSPKLFRMVGFEWLPRLIQEPRRLFRRNFISSPLFLKDVIFEKIRR